MSLLFAHFIAIIIGQRGSVVLCPRSKKSRANCRFIISRDVLPTFR